MYVYSFAFILVAPHDFPKNLQDFRCRFGNRKHPGTVFAVYTAYESDEHGTYTYFLGGEVTSFEGVALGVDMLTIPAQSYVKFISNSGAMPDVVITMWQVI